MSCLSGEQERERGEREMWIRNGEREEGDDVKRGERQHPQLVGT